MTLTPFDIPAPNADDPSPRSVVPMFPHRMAQATRDDAALQAIRDRLNREARHITIRPTWRDDRPDLIAALRDRRPSTLERIADALNAPFGFGLYVGFVAGCFFTVALAYAWSFAL